MEPRCAPLAVLVSLLAHIAHHSVDSAGQLQLRIVSFTNPDSLLADGGRCCRTSNGIDDATCAGPCRTVIRVCAAADGTGVPLRPPVRLSRISRLRSRRGRRSPVAASQQYTDTAVPSGLPPIGEEDELLPAEHRSTEPSGGTSIQVIHRLISTAEEEPRPPTARSTAEDVEPEVLPLEESSGPPEDAEITSSSEASTAESPASDDVTTDRSPLEGSALVGRPESQQQPDDPQDIGLVFVEDKDYIHLYFQPKRSRTRRKANGGSAGDPPRREKSPHPGDRQSRSVRVVLLNGGGVSSSTGTLNDLPLIVDKSEDLTDVGEGSGSEELREERDERAQDEDTASGRVVDDRQGGQAPRITAECPLGVLFAGVATNGSLESSELISLPFDTPWPGKLNLVIEAWHDVTGALEPSAVDLSQLTPGPPARLIGRAVLRRPLVAGAWSSDVITAGAARAEVETLVRCSPGSNGPHCATACDLVTGRGHWRCPEDGSPVCQAGWKGPSCDQPVCRPGCSPHTGYCRVPGECLCKIGYQGELCSQCVPLPGCRHGSCKRSFECRCRDGWTGLFCNKPICSEGCDKDRGYCSQPNECRCRPGWRGAHCDQCERLPGCRHGNCQQPLECRCRPGWTGFLCERAICREGCSKRHGYCEQPGVCRCELGWRGPLCDTCLPYPGCLHGNCTEPWQCNCHPGWTGFLCDKPVEPCSHQTELCRNGGTCETVLEEGLPAARCRCRAGYGGATCEEPNTPEVPPIATARSIASGGRDGGAVTSVRSGGRWRWGRPHAPVSLARSGLGPVRSRLGTARPGLGSLPWRRRFPTGL